MQTKVGTDYTHVVRHNLSHLAHILSDKNLFFVRHCTFVIPFRNFVVERIVIDNLKRMFSGCIGIDDSLYERVRSKTVSTMQTCARAFTNGIEAMDG